MLAITIYQLYSSFSLSLVTAFEFFSLSFSRHESCRQRYTFHLRPFELFINAKKLYGSR